MSAQARDVASDRTTWDEVFTRKRWGRWPNESVIRAVMRHVAPGARVLEVGCGAGAQLRFLTDEGFRPIGVDFSRPALDQATSNAPGVPLVHGDGSRLPFPSARFDVVVDVEAFTCAPNPAGMVAEALRVLAPGGLLISVGFTDGCTEDVGRGSGRIHAHDIARGLTVIDVEVVRREHGETVIEERTVTARTAN